MSEQPASISCGDWELTFPERVRRGFGSVSAKARLVRNPAGDSELLYELPLAVARALRTRVRQGANVASGSQLDELLNELFVSCGRSKIEDLINRKEFCSAEVSQRLLRDGYPQAIVRSLIDRAIRAGVIDDARYAELFVRSRLLAGWGRLRIERELQRRGIRELQTLEELFDDADDEYTRARELASRRRLSGKNDQAKIARFLYSKGFRQSICYDVAREVVNQAE